MKHFTDLYTALDRTTKTSQKIDALKRYFLAARPHDAAWAIYFLCGRKIRRIIPTRRLCQWAAEAAGIPEWLFDESREVVGDLAETMALVLPDVENALHRPLAEWVEQHLVPLRAAGPSAQREAMLQIWREIPVDQRFVLHKLITGAFRVGVSQRLVTRGLSEAARIEPEVLAHRLTGDWEPSAAFYQALLHPETGDTPASQPYPFFLAHPLTQPPHELGPLDDWQAEWKWDGIRTQLIRRSQQTYLWSRGGELMTGQFPELLDDAARLPDGTVMDGEILAWKEGVLHFSVLQKRIGRKKPGSKILADAPVIFLAFDLLEQQGRDMRPQPLDQRRQQLEALVQRTASLASDSRIRLSPLVAGGTWQQLADTRRESRQRNTEGLMLKRRDSAYGVGRPRGDWWKWKIEPYTADAVLIYAQRGSGRRASLYTDYTFAVWKGSELIPFAKAYSGLTDDEIRQVDAFVRHHTLERFGPVRRVKPELVFELAFENIQQSTRHKSGLAVRFPRIVRWRRDKAIEQADTLQSVAALISDSP